MINKFRRNLINNSGVVSMILPFPLHACAIPWRELLILDEKNAPTPTNDDLYQFLDQELGIGKWVIPKQEYITISTQTIPETFRTIPLLIRFQSIFSKITVYIESHIPYFGDRYSEFKYQRHVSLNSFLSPTYLIIRHDLFSYQFHNDLISEVATRFRAPQADYRLIIVGNLLNPQNGIDYFVRLMPLVKDNQPHCGGIYAIDKEK